MARTVTGTGGLWSANGTWVEGSPPGTADVVTIPKNTSVIVDDTTAVADSIVLSNGTTGADVGGILTCTTSDNWKLTLQNGITTVATSNPSNTATYTSSINFDMSASAYTGELVVNAAGGTTAAFGNVLLYGNYVFKGAVRKRHSVIESALTAAATTSVFVTDATGWKVGDNLIFATTSAWNASPRTDRVEIDSITFDNAPTNTGRAQITWSESLGYAHASGCPVGNFTSNLIFRPATNNARSTIVISSVVNQQSADCYMDNVAFGARVSGADYGCYATQSPGGALFFTYANAGPNWSLKHTGITNNSFYQYRQGGMAGNYLMGPLPRNNNIFYSTHASGSGSVMWTNINGKYSIAPDEDYVIFASISGIQNTTTLGAPINYPGCVQRRHKISGIIDSGDNGAGICTSMDIEDCDLWSNYLSLSVHYDAKIKRCRFDDGVFAGATGAASPYGHFVLAPTAKAEVIDCEFGSGVVPRAYGVTSLDARKLTVVNRNPAANGAAIQEIFQYQSQTVPAIQRNTATVSRSTSSMEFTLNTATAQEYEFEVLAKAGETVKLLVLVRKSSSPAYGASTLPKVTISGLGIMAVTETMDAGTAADAWETLTVEATNTGSADGNFTVTFAAQSATAGAKAFFAGIPAAPFITRCRHYGYLFNETSPTRTVDPTIDTGISEATAIGYGNSGTDLEVTWGVSSTLAVKVSSTFKKVYHFTQADGCLNVGSAMPLTGAGLDDSPALFAAGNVTISDGAVLNGSGSISMDTFTLSTEFAGGVNYTYTGGTWSQATTVPTFSGGTLNIGAAGTYTYTQAAAMILSMTPTAPGTYALGATTFTGQVDLRNTAAHAITVELPTGTSYTTASNTGGTITVTVPVVTADISITSMPNDAAGNTRLQIINKTALSASAWAANTVYATGALVKRSTGIGSESTAGLYFRATTGGTSHATTEPTWNTTPGGTTTDNGVTWTTYKVLYYDTDPAATSLADTYVDGEEFLAGETAEIRFAEMNGATSFKTYSTEVAIATTGFSALVAEEADAVFATFAIDGSTLEATFSPNFTSDYIVLDSNTDFSGKGAFAYYCYTLTTSAGMYNFWGGVTALDEGNIRINTSILNLYFDESAGFVKQTDDVRIFRSDGTRPAIDPTTGGHGIEINWRTPVSVVTTGGSAVLPQDIVDIAAASAAAVVADGKTLTVPKFLGLK